MEQNKIIEIELIKFKIDGNDSNLKRVDMSQIPAPQPGDILILFYSSGWCSYSSSVESVDGKWNENLFSKFKDGDFIPPRSFFVINNSFIRSAI